MNGKWKISIVSSICCYNKKRFSDILNDRIKGIGNKPVGKTNRFRYTTHNSSICTYKHLNLVSILHTNNPSSLKDYFFDLDFTRSIHDFSNIILKRLL